MTENQPSGAPGRQRLFVLPGADRSTLSSIAARQEELLDQAIEDTFPASDPISPMIIT